MGSFNGEYGEREMFLMVLEFCSLSREWDLKKQENVGASMCMVGKCLDLAVSHSTSVGIVF